VARLLHDHEDDIDTIELVTGDGSIFDVHVDGTLVFTRAMLGRYPEPDDVFPLVAKQLSS
jgi:predicted Rdx family selenoprotein